MLVVDTIISARGAFLIWMHNMRNMTSDESFVPKGAPPSKTYEGTNPALTMVLLRSDSDLLLSCDNLVSTGEKRTNSYTTTIALSYVEGVIQLVRQVDRFSMVAIALFQRRTALVRIYPYLSACIAHN